MSVSAIHGYLLGFLVIGSWATICFWALALRLTRYGETPTFWRAVSVAQVLLSLQLLLGLVLGVLFAMGRVGLPGDGSAFQVTFHVLYGVLFPMIVLVVGHRAARDGRYDAHSVFSVVGLVNFGLTARAWMVGVSAG